MKGRDVPLNHIVHVSKGEKLKNNMNRATRSYTNQYGGGSGLPSAYH